MSDLKAKMHQIRFPLGLRPRPRWRSLQRSPDPLAVFKGPTSKRREGVRKSSGVVSCIARLPIDSVRRAYGVLLRPI